MTTETEQPKMDVAICKSEDCESKLFVNWGMEIVLTPANWKTNARGEPSQFQNKQTAYMVKACAHCKTPYYMDEGELVNASDLISQEEVQAAINALASMPQGARARTIDP